MLSDTSEKNLNQFEDIIKSTGARSHHTAHDYDRAVNVSVDLYFEDEVPHVDDVRHWAEAHGWEQGDARDLGEMADTVMFVMQQLRNESRLT